MSSFYIVFGRDIPYGFFFFTVHENLFAIIKTLYTERDHLKTALETDSNNSGSQAVIKNLQNSLLQTIQQNNELRTRLNNIHAESDISQLSDSVSVIILPEHVYFSSMIISSALFHRDSTLSLK